MGVKRLVNFADAAGKSQDMPRIFAQVNRNNVPVTALWVTSIIIQLIVISTYWSNDAFALMLNLTSATTLIPYVVWRRRAAPPPAPGA